jgi:hypothetical protein
MSFRHNPVVELAHQLVRRNRYPSPGASGGYGAISRSSERCDNGSIAGRARQKYKIERSEDCLEIGLVGTSIYRSQFLQEHPLPAVSLENLDRPLYRNFRLGDRKFRAVSEQIEVEGRVYVVRIAKPMDDESEAFVSFRRYLLWTGFFLVLIAYAVGYPLSRRVMAGNQIR